MKAVANKNQPGSSTAPGPLERLQGHLGVQLWGTPHQSPGGQVVLVAPVQGRGAAGTPEVPAEGQHNTHPLLMVCTPKPRAPSRSHHAFDCRSLLLLLSLRGRAKPSGLVCSLLFRGSSQNTQLWARAQTKPRRDCALPRPCRSHQQSQGTESCVFQVHQASFKWLLGSSGNRFGWGFFQCRKAASALQPPWGL